MAHKILIIGPSWVGDMVMAQSLFKLIKKRKPHAEIHVLAPAWTFTLLSRMPEVACAIELPFQHGEFKWRERYQFAQILRAEHYDEAIVLPNSFKSAFIPFFARIPKRIGWVGECRYGLLTDARRLDKKRYPLMVEQYLALGLEKHETLIKPYPYPTFSLTEKAQIIAKYPFANTTKPILVLCPGAAFGPSKQWPTDYFATVANQQIAANWDVWIIGSKADQPIAEEIMQLTEQRCRNIPDADLADAIDLLSMANGVLTNDSGLMHVAAALNKPLIVVYGSTSPAFTPPLGEHATILQLNLDCQPCFKRTCPLGHHRCMRELTPAKVLAVMNEWRV